jgi:ATP-binding cassette subfamily B protein
VFELLDKPEEVTDSPNAAAVALTEGSVKFDQVSFGYSGRDKVLHDVSFQVQARSTCVIVGASGAGKSTIADLLMRFYDPASGSISVDRHDLRSIRLHDLRARVALVDQSPFFFHGTIRENLLFASPDASPSDYENAARSADIQSFIEALPDKYETTLGERGLTLSAGQRQRLAIARALLRKPSILILDEPSAALDPATEFALSETLRGLASSCTIVVVTHRPALVEIADQVILLDRGQVAENGSPRELFSVDSKLSRHFREIVSFGATQV